MRGEVGVLGGGKATALGKYGLELVGYKLVQVVKVLLGKPSLLDSCRLGRGRRESESYSFRSTVNSLKLSARRE